MQHFLIHVSPAGAVLCITLLAAVAPTPEAVRNFKLSNFGHLRRSAASVDPPLIWQDKKETTQVCGQPNKVNSSSDKWERCPDSCPIYAEVKPSELHCQFECVPLTVEACKARNPKAPIPDKKLGLCRSCMIDGCAKCANDGTDTCLECNRGFARLGSRRCENKALIIWIIAFGILGFITVVVILWIVNLANRPVVNESGLNHGLALRSRAKLTMPVDADQSAPATPGMPQSNVIPTIVMPEPRQRGLWPLDTNLLNTRVAGPGLMLQFNLQFWLIIWATGVAIAWAITASFFPDLFILGTRRAETPRQNCILVAWGYEKQHGLMWVKVVFTLALYVVSFVLCILFSIRQLRIFQLEDAEETTHKDFSAVISGLPQIDGHERIEEELATAVERATSVGVVGVSVCWDYSEQEATFMSLIEHELCDREGIPSLKPDAIPEGSARRGIFHRMFQRVEKTFLSPTTQKVLSKGKKTMRHHRLAKHSINPVHLTPRRDLSRETTGIPSGAASPSPVVEVNVEEMLWKLKTCNQAFVVFNSEEDRDAAIRQVSNEGFSFRDCKLKLDESDCEPNTVIWKNCTNETSFEKGTRVAKGLGVILLALAAWVCVFYLPYAHYAMSFNYAYGQEPGGIESFTFSMLVVAGNAAMYLICSEVADYVGFQNVDSREVCYMLLYNFACVFNVVLDIAVTYLVAYEMMVGQNMRTYHGVHLKNVDTFIDRVETYAMQREMGKSLWRYSWPSTFLLPFLIEPIITIYIPYKLMSWVVRSNSKYRSYHAERFLTSTPMDLSRYADVLLNVILAVLILFFPGGYTLGMFATLAVSHIFIYGYDHWRVLRSIPSCEFANMNVDWWAQWLLSVPCGLLLSGGVYKWAVDTGSKGWGFGLVFVVSAVFVAHVVIHTSLLLWFVPLFGRKEKPPSNMSYKQCGRRIACSWFSANPVYCLRSNYIYHHEPPCDFCVAGKEHLLRVNEDIGLHFDDAPIEAENYDETAVDVRSVLRTLSTRFSQSSAAQTPAAASDGEAKNM